MPNESEIYNKLGKLEAMAEQGMAEREKIFEKLDVIVDRINSVASVNAAVVVADSKAEKAHERLDKLVDHLDGVKTRALLIIGGSGISGGALGHFGSTIIKKLGLS